MHFKEFSLVSPKIPSKEIFKAIEIAIPASAIDQAIAKTNVEEKRYRALPAQLVVCLVIAMSLWSKDSMRDVLKNLIDGLMVLMKHGEKLVNIGGFPVNRQLFKPDKD